MDASDKYAVDSDSNKNSFSLKEQDKKFAESSLYLYSYLIINIAEIVNDFMVELNLNKKEFAKHVGISKKELNKILKGHDNVSLLSIMSIAIKMGMLLTVDFLTADQILKNETYQKYIAMYGTTLKKWGYEVPEPYKIQNSENSN